MVLLESLFNILKNEGDDNMNKEEVKLSVKDLLDEIKEIKGESGMLILKKENYTSEEVADIRKEIECYLDKIK